jgi:GxxExxY protein
VLYKNARLDCGFRADFIVEETLILELKSVENLTAIHQAQLLTYMKLCDCQTGLLMNFNVKHLRDGIKRFVL